MAVHEVPFLTPKLGSLMESIALWIDTTEETFSDRVVAWWTAVRDLSEETALDYGWAEPISAESQKSSLWDKPIGVEHLRQSP